MPILTAPIDQRILFAEDARSGLCRAVPPRCQRRSAGSDLRVKSTAPRSRSSAAGRVGISLLGINSQFVVPAKTGTLNDWSHTALMVRSAAKQSVSNHGAAPSFETRPSVAPQDEAEEAAEWFPGFAEPVVGPRCARTRWLARDDRLG